MRGTTRRAAVIDIGSNSIKLLIADFQKRDLERIVAQETEETRIGGGLGSEGNKLTEESMRSAVLSVERLVQVAREHTVDQLRILATSAVREASNQEVLCHWIQQVVGISVEVLDADTEARLIFSGVQMDPALKGQPDSCVLDQGGGSMEFILPVDGDLAVASLPLGAVRCFKRFHDGSLGPMTPQQMECIERWVDDHWEPAFRGLAVENRSWVVTGGAFTVFRAWRAREAGISFEASSSELTLEELTAFLDRVACLSVEERITRENLPAARADILPAGLAAAVRVLRRAAPRMLRHSLYSLRFGAARQLVS